MKQLKYHNFISHKGFTAGYLTETKERALETFKMHHKEEPKLAYLSTTPASIRDLLNKTFTKVEKLDNSILFTSPEGCYFLHHEQECCEEVWIESIVGDLDDLMNSPILLADEIISNMEGADESGTYTFYKLATIKGYVDIRWVGESNGFYSETVDIRFIPKESLTCLNSLTKEKK